MVIRDPEKRREYQREWARRNAAKRNEYQVRNRREFMKSVKDKPCTDCGVRYPHYVMEFDHKNVGDKIANVTDLVRRMGKAQVLIEIAKCDLVCSNCHRVRTWQRNQDSPE